MAFRRRPVADNQLVWYSRDGARLQVIEGAGNWGNPDLSPDGTQLAVQRNLQRGTGEDIWIVDVQKGTSRALSSERGGELYPIWRPDGSAVSFGRYPGAGAGSARGSGAWVTNPLDGTPERSVNYDVTGNNMYVEYAPDGASLLGFGIGPAGNRDIFLRRLEGSQPPVPVVESPFNDTQPAISRDGKWLAYVSDEAGVGELRHVYVQAFPEGGRRQQVSLAIGGVQPRWRRDGRELYYLGLDRRLMAVPVVSAGLTLQLGEPQPLFQTSAPAAAGVGVRATYAVTADGQRFVISEPRDGGDDRGTPITLLLNWTAALRTGSREERE
jgi:Tol biopolymer transport system component